jgi:3-carboxy-cis,cis-muconate cycloisomerase
MTNAFTSSALFGDLLRDDAIGQLFSAQVFLKHAVAFETAWTETLITLGAVTSEDGAAALAALRGFAPDLVAIGDSSNQNGLPIPGFVKQLRAGLPDSVGKAIHSGTTSQDVIDTALVLILLDALEEMGARLHRVVKALSGLSRDAKGTMMGRTRMQAALPIPVAARIQTWLNPLRDHLDRLDGLRTELGQVQLGGAVGLRDLPTGQGDRAAMEMAQRLGLQVGPVWHSNRTPMLDVGHWLTLVSGSLGKVGQDVTLMAQQGIAEVKLSGGGGSSAMPHKANPVLAETLVTLARFVGVQQGGLTQVMVHEQERSGAMWTLEWLLLPPMVEATAAGLRHAEALLGQIERIGPASEM